MSNKFTSLSAESIGVIILMVSMLIFLPYFPGAYTLFYRAIIIFCAGIFIFFLSARNRKEISYSSFDLLFLAYILLQFFSFFWAINPVMGYPHLWASIVIYLFYRLGKTLPKAALNITTQFVLASILIFNILVIGYYYFKVSLEKEDGIIGSQMIERISHYLDTNSHNAAIVLFSELTLLLLLGLHHKLKWTLPILFLGFLLAFSLSSAAANLVVTAVLLLLLLILNTSINWTMVRVGFSAILIGVIFGVIMLPLMYRAGMLPDAAVNHIPIGFFERLKIWSNTYSMSSTHFLFGQGNGNWVIEYTQFRNDHIDAFKKGNQLYSHAHNEWVQIYAELGLVGFLIYFSILFQMFRDYLVSLRHDRKNLASLIGFSLLFIFVGCSLFYGIAYMWYYSLSTICLATFIYYGYWKAHYQGVGSKSYTLNWSRIASLFFAAGLIYAMLVYTNFSSSMTKLKWMRKQYFQGNTETAMRILDSYYEPYIYENFRGRNTITPLAFYYYKYYSDNEFLDKAQEALEYAVSIHPFNGLLWEHLASLYIKMGKTEEALCAAKKSNELDRNTLDYKDFMLEHKIQQTLDQNEDDCTFDLEAWRNRKYYRH